jgi:hypothetical protein
MYCWIQVTREETKRLESEEQIPKKSGYQYFDPETGVNRIEYHVDTCDLFQEKMNGAMQFREKFSVIRDKNKETIIMVGYDECIFRQYALTNKSWNGPQGQKPLHQKIQPRNNDQRIPIPCIWVWNGVE